MLLRNALRRAAPDIENGSPRKSLASKFAGTGIAGPKA